MQSPIEHLGKGIGWYLDNGDFVKKHNENIVFVGKQETIHEDVTRLSRDLRLELRVTHKRVRETMSNDDSRHLSSLSINNLVRFFSDTEYKALEALHTAGWIDEAYLKRCYLYNEWH